MLYREKRALALIKGDRKSKKVLAPYLVGREVLSGDGKPNRFLIDFDQASLFEAQEYCDAFEYVRDFVLPDIRSRAAEEHESESAHKDQISRWWLHWRPRYELKAAIRRIPRFLVCSRVTKRPIFIFIDSEIRPGDALQAFAFSDDYSFGVLQSNAHWQWFIAKCSKLKSDFRYTPESVFDTFPWPQSPTLAQTDAVAEAGRQVRRVRVDALLEDRRGIASGLPTTGVAWKEPPERRPSVSRRCRSGRLRVLTQERPFGSTARAQPGSLPVRTGRRTRDRPRHSARLSRPGPPRDRGLHPSRLSLERIPNPRELPGPQGTVQVFADSRMEPPPVVSTSCCEAPDRVLHLLTHLLAGEALGQAPRIEAPGSRPARETEPPPTVRPGRGDLRRATSASTSRPGPWSSAPSCPRSRPSTTSGYQHRRIGSPGGCSTSPAPPSRPRSWPSTIAPPWTAALAPGRARASMTGHGRPIGPGPGNDPQDLDQAGAPSCSRSRPSTKPAPRRVSIRRLPNPNGNTQPSRPRGRDERLVFQAHGSAERW